jgi:hypothetical protein
LATQFFEIDILVPNASPPPALVPGSPPLRWSRLAAVRASEQYQPKEAGHPVMSDYPRETDHPVDVG